MRTLITTKGASLDDPTDKAIAARLKAGLFHRSRHDGGLSADTALLLQAVRLDLGGPRW